MCMIDDSEDYALVLRERHSRARIAHRCSECFRTIRPGEHYLNEAYVCVGEFLSHKTCAHCGVVREWLRWTCGGFLYSGIREDITEHAGSGLYGFGVLRLASGMRLMWTRKSGALWPIPRLSFKPEAA